MIRALGLAVVVVAAAAKAPPPPSAPPRPPPKVDVVLTAAAPSAGWSVKVTNSGTVPVRIVADARLLDFEVTAPTGGAKVHCALPADMIPQTDMERGLVLVPGRSFTEKFDPRLFCFSERDAAALVAGATITGHYGFGGRSATGPKAFVPLVSDATDPTAPAAVKAIDFAPVTLPAAPAPVAVAPAVASTDGIKLVPTAPARIDLERTFERQVTISVRNAGPLAVRSLFTPATVGFVLTGPDGTVSQCGATVAPSPIPERLTTLSPTGRTDVTVGLALCPSEAFKKDGLYQLRPHVDTRRLGASTLTLYRGEVTGEPSLLRLHTSTTPRLPPVVDPP